MDGWDMPRSTDARSHTTSPQRTRHNSPTQPTNQPTNPPTTPPQSKPDGIPTVGLARQPPALLALYVWLYCLACWIVQDAAKVFTYRCVLFVFLIPFLSSGLLVGGSCWCVGSGSFGCVCVFSLLRVFRLG
jgi:hypothetical protein